MASKEKRSFVRGYFHFQVKFRIVLKEEYEAIQRTGERYKSSHKKRFIIDDTNADKSDKGTSPYSDIVEFLLYIDEKLDHIIQMLSDHEPAKGIFYEGKGLNISGTGMGLEVYRQVQSGQIIHANFVLSKSPLFFMDVLGEIVRVTPVQGDGKECYRIGIRFLDLSESDRERVIACVFQKQRDAIRNKQRQGIHWDS